MKPYMVKKVPSQPFVKNTVIPFSLPLGGKIGKGYVILDGTVVVSAGTTSGVKKGAGLINLIKNIVVRANPADGSRYKGGEVVNADPLSLLSNAITQDTKLVLDLLGLSATTFNGDAATYTIYCAIPVYFADPNVMRQWQTALNADIRAFKSIQVEIQTGDVANCFTGNDRTVDYSGLSVRWVDERHNFAGDTFELVQESHQTLIPATKKDFVDARIPSTGSFLSWMLMTETTAAQTLTDSILNNVKINGDAIEFDVTKNDIRQRMVNDGWFDASQVATGYYFLDLTDGNLLAAVPAPGLTHEFDITMLTTANVDALHLFTRRIFVPAGFNAQQMLEYAGK